MSERLSLEYVYSGLHDLIAQATADVEGNTDLKAALQAEADRIERLLSLPRAALRLRLAKVRKALLTIDMDQPEGEGTVLAAE